MAFPTKYMRKIIILIFFSWFLNYLLSYKPYPSNYEYNKNNNSQIGVAVLKWCADKDFCTKFKRYIEIEFGIIIITQHKNAILRQRFSAGG